MSQNRFLTFVPKYNISTMWLRLCAFSLLIMASLLVQAASNGVAIPGFAGVELKILDEIVPPGGMLQMKVSVTEPKPILKGRQGARFLQSFSAPQGAALFNQIQGIALFSKVGDASAVAVLGSGDVQFYFNSPLSSFGTGVDYPVMVVDIPVAADAVAGQTADLTLDTSTAQWLDPSSQEYPLLFSPGVMTVGGNISISSVTPGGTVVPAGKTISIKGVGFNPDAKVQINNANVATSHYISANEVQVTLNRSVNMEHQRVRVTNQSTNERAEYYSYQRTAALGSSTHPLVAASYPLFSRATWTQAYLDSVLHGTMFSGLALQNLRAQTARVRLELYSAQGVLLTARSVSVPTNTRMARDFVELFPGFTPSDGTWVRIVSATPVQVLGLLGDDASGQVLPVEPSATP